MTNIRKIQNSVKPLMMPFSKAEPAGARLRRPKRRVELVKEAFSETAGIQSLAQEKGPGDIILGYLGGSEGTEGGKGQ